MALEFGNYPIMAYAIVAIGSLILYRICLMLYRLYFDPLSVYPGPRLWAMSKMPNAYYLCIGRIPYKLAQLHEQYGPVVRVAPDELSYILEEAWQDIYGKLPGCDAELSKDASQFITPPNGIYGLLMEPSSIEHARMRRILAPGFSEKALRDQEPYMKKYFDLLIQRLHENCGQPVDIVDWYHLTTFDLIGDLTFGESFDCLETSKMHFWVKTLFKATKPITLLGRTMKFSPLDKIILSLAPSSLREKERVHRSLTKEKLLRRLEEPQPRQDFLCYVQEHLNKPNGMSFEELHETCGVLIAAGSETTATLLSAATYYILTNPSILKKLTAEIRGAFKSEADITMASVNSLSYELAVLNETLRIYPPANGNQPRVTPPEGCMIAGRFVPGNKCVGIPQWSANHSSANFRRPNDFVPERWTGDLEFKDDKRRVVQPFGCGPRNCIGRSLAYAEMRVLLARVIWSFDLELCEESRRWGIDQQVFFFFVKPPLIVKLKLVVRT